jgi:hypothetical protein
MLHDLYLRAIADHDLLVCRLPDAAGQGDEQEAGERSDLSRVACLCEGGSRERRDQPIDTRKTGSVADISAASGHVVSEKWQNRIRCRMRRTRRQLVAAFVLE